MSKRARDRVAKLEERMSTRTPEIEDHWASYARRHPGMEAVSRTLGQAIQMHCPDARLTAMAVALHYCRDGGITAFPDELRDAVAAWIGALEQHNPRLLAALRGDWDRVRLLEQDLPNQRTHHITEALRRFRMEA